MEGQTHTQIAVKCLNVLFFFWFFLYYYYYYYYSILQVLGMQLIYSLTSILRRTVNRLEALSIINVNQYEKKREIHKLN